jgi:hypothetical protein
MSPIEPTCPKCGSKDTQAVPALILSGTTIEKNLTSIIGLKDISINFGKKLIISGTAEKYYLRPYSTIVWAGRGIVYGVRLGLFGFFVSICSGIAEYMGVICKQLFEKIYCVGFVIVIIASIMIILGYCICRCRNTSKKLNILKYQEDCNNNLWYCHQCGSDWFPNDTVREELKKSEMKLKSDYDYHPWMFRNK